MATGKQLRDARKKRKLTAEAVAQRVGVSVNTIYAWESDASKPRDEKVQKKLHDLLGLHVGSGNPVTEKVKKARASRARLTPTEHETAKLLARAKVKSLFVLLAFFMKDQARRSTLLQLLKEADEHELTIGNLIEMLDGGTPPAGL